jgi:hypothetical protein
VKSELDLKGPAGQWEQYVAAAAEAIDPAVFRRKQEWMRRRTLGMVRTVLKIAGPLIAEDTRVRMVEAAAEIVKRETSNRIAVSGYTVYPTAYHETEIPSDKHSFVITVKDRGQGWAVCWMGDVLNRDGEWEWEVQPSSRDDDFFLRCRFTEDEAKRRAAEAVDKLTINGRTFAEAVRWMRSRP